MGTTTQRYRSTRDFNWEVISFQCGGWCILTTQNSTAVMMQGAWASLAGRQRVTNTAEKPRLTACNLITGSAHIYLVHNEIVLAVPQSRPIVPHQLHERQGKYLLWFVSGWKNKRRTTINKCSAPCWDVTLTILRHLHVFLSAYELVVLPLCTHAVRFNNTANCDQNNNRVVLRRALWQCVFIKAERMPELLNCMVPDAPVHHLHEGYALNQRQQERSSRAAMVPYSVLHHHHHRHQIINKPADKQKC